MTDLDFIKDDDLRETLDNAIKYIYVLYEQSKKNDSEDLYLEETYRIVILYVVSAIEAILLYFYKERGEKITYIEYKCVHTIPEYESNLKPDFPVVIAVQEMVKKKEHQIGLHDLVLFFKSKKLMHDKTAVRILAVNDVRNTFHFNKPRAKKCDLSQVEDALNLLLYVLEHAPKALMSK